MRPVPGLAPSGVPDNSARHANQLLFCRTPEPTGTWAGFSTPAFAQATPHVSVATRKSSCQNEPKLFVEGRMRPRASSSRRTSPARSGPGPDRGNPALRGELVAHRSSVKQSPLKQAAFQSRCSSQEHPKVLIRFPGIHFPPKIEGVDRLGG
jgi:hypothetical protein